MTTTKRISGDWQDGRTRSGRAVRVARAERLATMDLGMVTGFLLEGSYWLYGIMPRTIEIDQELKLVTFLLEWSNGEIRHYTIPLERIAGYQESLPGHEDGPGAPLTRAEFEGRPGLGGTASGQSQELSHPDEQGNDTTKGVWGSLR
jgi:hypothetical protein